MITVLVNILGVLIFLFILWKRLKEDYASQVVFSSAFYILLGLTVGYLVTFFFFKQWFFWGAFVGSMLGLGISVFKLRLRFYETFEAMVLSFLPALSLIFLKDSVINSSLVSFSAFLVVLFVIFVFSFLDGHYREFTWYTSGKIGFVGLSTLGFFFLIRTGVAIFFHDVLSFVGKSEVFVSGTLAFICFLMIFNLARKE
jgi:hypothetical protein